MNKRKSIVVTVLVAGMLALLLYAAWRMGVKAFPILLGTLAGYGYVCGAANFCRWLGKEPVLLPAHVHEEPAISTEAEDIEDILAEMRGEV